MAQLIFLNPDVWYSGGIHERVFRKINFEKNQHKKKRLKNYPVCKEVNPLTVEIGLMRFCLWDYVM